MSSHYYVNQAEISDVIHETLMDENKSSLSTVRCSVKEEDSQVQVFQEAALQDETPCDAIRKTDAEIPIKKEPEDEGSALKQGHEDTSSFSNVSPSLKEEYTEMYLFEETAVSNELPCDTIVKQDCVPKTEAEIPLKEEPLDEELAINEDNFSLPIVKNELPEDDSKEGVVAEIEDVLGNERRAVEVRTELNNKGTAAGRRDEVDRYPGLPLPKASNRNYTSGASGRATSFSTAHSEKKCFTCNICGKSLKRKQALDLHLVTHSEDRPYSCAICHKTFKRPDTLRTHLIVHNEDRPFSCDVCGNSFKRSDSLTDHLRIHSGEKRFGCKICGKSFLLSTHLNTHIRIHSGEKPFCCSICGRTFTQGSSLASHERVHSGEKSFFCSTCDKAFSSRKTLTKHLRVHSEVKPYVCSTCGKAFKRKESLSLHAIMHSEERPFSCTFCSKTFKRPDSLAVHIRGHKGDKRYCCKFCDKRFLVPSHLKQHERVHTREKPFFCETCGKSFSQVSHLNNHQRVHK